MKRVLPVNGAGAKAVCPFPERDSREVSHRAEYCSCIGTRQPGTERPASNGETTLLLTLSTDVGRATLPP